ncbi:MAG: phosphoribosyltransferase domain-containing protein [Desulfococcaceae bacterium]
MKSVMFRQMGQQKNGSPETFCPEKDMYFLKRENNALRREAVSFSCLGKIRSTGQSCLFRWKQYLDSLLLRILKNQGVSAYPLVIGLAESGIIPSGLFHQLLREKSFAAGWICSTRRPASGIRFTESHSHGPDHVLPLPEGRPTELWFVEDEITTGCTLLRLSLSLCRHLHLRQVRFLAFSDNRNAAGRKHFQTILWKEGIKFSIHTLADPAHRGNTEATVLHPDSRMQECDSVTEIPDISAQHDETHWNFPEHRPALKEKSDIRIPFGENLHGTLLAVGEAVDLGLRIVQNSAGLELRHITLSPWEMDSRHIFSRLDIGEKYYLYNYHTLRPPLHILSDPIDAETGREAAALLSAKGFSVRHLDMGQI